MAFCHGKAVGKCVVVVAVVTIIHANEKENILLLIENNSQVT